MKPHKFLLLIILLPVFFGTHLGSQVAADEMTASTLLQSYFADVATEKTVPMIDKAIVAFKAQQFAAARQLLDSARKTNPALPPTGLLLARMLFAANQPAAARVELEKLVRDHPADPGAYLLLAELAIAESRFSEAKFALNESKKLIDSFTENEFRKNQMNTRTLLGLAALEENQQDWAAAVKLLKSIDDGDSESSVVQARLARALFKNKETDAAYAVLKQQWERNKDTTQIPEITMAVYHRSAGDEETAKKLMKSVAADHPKNSRTQITVGQWALEVGEMELAEQCADRAMTASDSSLQARLMLALVLRYKGDYQAARKQLEAAHLQSPANLAAMLELSVVLSNIPGSENLAIQYAQIATKLQPDLRKPAGRGAAISLAWILFRHGGEAEALKIAKQVVEQGQISLESRFYLAMILMNSDRPAAKRILQELINSKRAFPGLEQAKKVYEQTDW
ncbi:MAG: tetratricopeptide repeat protein [Mariniblastus sp.]